MLSKGLSGVFSSTRVQGINSSALYLLYGPALTPWEDHSIDYRDLCRQSDGSAFQHTVVVITFLPRSICLLISWLQSPSVEILEPKKRKSVTTSTFSSSICHEVMGPDAMILAFLILNFKPALSLSSFTLIKRLFSSSPLSATRVVSSAYLRLLMFLFPTLIPALHATDPQTKLNQNQITTKKWHI